MVRQVTLETLQNSNTMTSTKASTMEFKNIVDSQPIYYSGRHLPLFAQKETPVTPSTKEVVALTTGAWHQGWNTNTWTPIPSFEEQWALAKTSEERASLLAFYSPTACFTLTYHQRSILMSVNLPTKKSDNLDAELTFCDGTLCARVCNFAYCIEDTSDDTGCWYCDECRNFANDDE